MANQTMGETICSLRKEKGMTQKELAEKMNVTDKAVSKWERNLSCPDINSIPALAEVLDVSVDVLLNASAKKEEKNQETGKIVNLVLKAVSMAMGIAVVTLSILKKIDLYSGFTMLGAGLACMGIYLFRENEG
ncbi:MAG: helix-turn-helix transcriptional regulator [Clostridiales bacterium]|nr:helix-turn-helix transcriptional regulator [Clostridiales bacterium]